MAVYILHFDSPIGSDLHRAQHYIGSSEKVFERIQLHGTGKSDVKIVNEFFRRGIGFEVGMIWHDADWLFERYLKESVKQTKRVCLVCRTKLKNSRKNEVGFRQARTNALKNFKRRALYSSGRKRKVLCRR